MTSSILPLVESEGRLIGRRWFALWVDFIFLMGGALATELIPHKEAALWLRVVLYLSYFPLMEGLLGQTVGKRLAGIMVVTVEGHKPGIIRAIARTFARLVETNPFLAGGLPAGIVVLLNPRGQRLGDFMAGTYVVRSLGLKEYQAAMARGEPWGQRETPKPSARPETALEDLVNGWDPHAPTRTIEGFMGEGQCVLCGQMAPRARLLYQSSTKLYAHPACCDRLA
ncbi:RDD family protein [Myxococcota bacterium]|nr:RDD family protein [Myxococcota bacterium]MBU1898652.1 RDD family protein [Myxococcota bacterium]